MCRNIKTLYNFEPPATDDEIRAAATQFVRKISGFAKPSTANEEAFSHAVNEITKSSAALLGSLVTNSPTLVRFSDLDKIKDDGGTPSCYPARNTISPQK